MHKNSILITGAYGYIGSALCQSLDSYSITPVSLRETPQPELDGIETIVHLSAIVHQPKSKTADYERVNRDQTLELAKNAKHAGIKQFIFFSTMAVYGGHGTLSHNHHPLTELTPCNPDTDYGRSKYHAESALLEMQSEQFIVSIVRPPLVYGPNCPGNMMRLAKLVQRFPTLPFANCDNKRSVVSIANLVQMVELIISHHASGVFLPQDPEPVSTSQLIGWLAEAQNVTTYQTMLPSAFVKLCAKLKPRLTSSLFGSLYYDNADTCDRLNYQPGQSTQQALQQMFANQ